MPLFYYQNIASIIIFIFGYKPTQKTEITYSYYSITQINSNRYLFVLLQVVLDFVHKRFAIFFRMSALLLNSIRVLQTLSFLYFIICAIFYCILSDANVTLCGKGDTAKQATNFYTIKNRNKWSLPRRVNS